MSLKKKLFQKKRKEQKKNYKKNLNKKKRKEQKKKTIKKNEGRSFFGIFYFCKKGTIRRDTKRL